MFFLITLYWHFIDTHPVHNTGGHVLWVSHSAQIFWIRNAGTLVEVFRVLHVFIFPSPAARSTCNGAAHSGTFVWFCFCPINKERNKDCNEGLVNKCSICLSGVWVCFIFKLEQVIEQKENKIPATFWFWWDGRYHNIWFAGHRLSTQQNRVVEQWLKLAPPGVCCQSRCLGSGFMVFLGFFTRHIFWLIEVTSGLNSGTT